MGFVRLYGSEHDRVVSLEVVATKPLDVALALRGDQLDVSIEQGPSEGWYGPEVSL
jgi:hypothetical protein